MNGEEMLSDWAGREVKVLEVIVEVEGRTILRPIRVLPHRVPVGRDGKVSMRARWRVSDLLAPKTVETAIRELERDASYFWIPTELHWSALGHLLKLPVPELKRALNPMPDSGP
jgi:hypothetical protein